MANRNIKKGDMVMVIAGKDNGKSGEVALVNAKDGKVVVNGLNIVSKSIKPRNAQEKGGIIKKEAPLEVSNVMVICPSCSKVTRVAHKEEEKDGKMVKIRICKKCGASLDEVKQPKKKVTASKKADSDADDKKKKATRKTAKKAEKQE